MPVQVRPSRKHVLETSIVALLGDADHWRQICSGGNVRSTIDIRRANMLSKYSCRNGIWHANIMSNTTAEMRYDVQILHTVSQWTGWARIDHVSVETRMLVCDRCSCSCLELLPELPGATAKDTWSYIHSYYEVYRQSYVHRLSEVIDMELLVATVRDLPYLKLPDLPEPTIRANLGYRKTDRSTWTFYQNYPRLLLHWQIYMKLPSDLPEAIVKLTFKWIYHQSYPRLSLNWQIYLNLPEAIVKLTDLPESTIKATRGQRTMSSYRQPDNVQS